MQNTVKIRLAVPGDAEELCKIYAPYVEKTAVSFEYQVPSAAGFREKLIGVHQGDPGEFIPLPDLERRVLEEIAGTLSGGGKEVELWR